MKSFSGKLMLAFSAVVAASMASAGLLLTRSFRAQLTDELVRSLQTQARIAAAEAGASASQAFADRVARSCACRVTLIDQGGAVLADSEVAAAQVRDLENHAARPEVAEARRAGGGWAIRFSQTRGMDMLYAAALAEGGGARSGAASVVRLAVPMAQIQEKLASLWRALGWITACTLLAAVLAALALARSLAQPTEEMARAAGRLARGDYAARVPEGSQDELGALARTLNSLAERIGATVTELSSERDQLNSILAGMVEGVVAVDGGGSVIAVNPALCSLFSLDARACKGRPFLEVLRHAALADILNSALVDRSPRGGEARLLVPDERVLECHAVPLETGALMVLHDVTALRRLEQVRREFVANASHELRTPLAAIKGFAETLLDGGHEDERTRLEFLRSIDRETDQLAALVDDILDLAAIESGRRVPAFSPIDLAEAAAEVAGKLRPLAERRGVTVSIGRQRVGLARADRGQMGQVLTNLLDNAIKFNREGGTVQVQFAEKGGQVSVVVEDQGIGIPAVDLPRIFERFYRVDKSHSRALGGTGLGLAIVKHIIEAHGGSVSVESVEGEGSRFEFRLPRA